MSQKRADLSSLGLYSSDTCQFNQLLNMLPADINWVFLSAAIFCEVIATSALKAAKGFTELVPTTIVALGYLATYYFLSLALRTIPIGVAYAIWSGVGLVFVSIIGYYVYDQSLDAMTMLGMGLIFIGVLVLNLFSGSS